MARGKSWLGRIVRTSLWVALGCVAFSVAAVVLLRWIDPPYSAFMAESQIEAWMSRDRTYVFRHNWVDLARISPNLPLAVVASEDQKFPEHWGFDVEAIEKAYQTQSAQPSGARCEHHQPASREEFVSVVRSQLPAQGARGVFHGSDRELLAQAAHPRDLPQYRRIRLRHLRRRGGRTALFPQTGRAPDAQRCRRPRRRAAEPEALFGSGAVAITSSSGATGF